MLTSLLYLQAIVLSSDGHNLVTGGDNGVVEVWQACDFKQLYVYPGCDAGIRAMDLSHDQRSEQYVTCVYMWLVPLKQLTQITVFTLMIGLALQYIQTLWTNERILVEPEDMTSELLKKKRAVSHPRTSIISQKIDSNTFIILSYFYRLNVRANMGICSILFTECLGGCMFV